jgi:Tol biopolymer transport system component
LTAVEHKFNFTVHQLNNSSIDILSLSTDGQLIVGHLIDKHLYIYYTDGRSNLTVLQDNNVELWDAAWTPRGDNIVYTNFDGVVVISLSGEFIATTNLSSFAPRYLTVTDDVIYLATYYGGVYQSMDSGVTWSHVFYPSNETFHSWQVIKVSHDLLNTDDFWAIEVDGEDDMSKRLQVYSRSKSTGNVTARSITNNGDYPFEFHLQRLAYDGDSTIIAICNNLNPTLYLFSINTYSIRQISLEVQFSLNNKPMCGCIDTSKHAMYVGYVKRGVIGVLTLSYEE